LLISNVPAAATKICSLVLANGSERTRRIDEGCRHPKGPQRDFENLKGSTQPAARQSWHSRPTRFEQPSKPVKLMRPREAQ